jgi:hypothetical protein
MAYFDPDCDIIIKMDAPKYVSASVLSQHSDDNIIHPMAYFSKTYCPMEYNYEIYDKELRVII